MSLDVEAARNGSGPTRRRTSRPSPDAAPTTPVPPRLPGRRNPRWIALGVVAICLGGLLSYAVYARVSTETRVLALASTLYRGEVVEAGDLTTVVLHGQPPGPTVSAADQATVVGKRAVFHRKGLSVTRLTGVLDASSFAASPCRCAAQRAIAALVPISRTRSAPRSLVSRR